MELLVVIAILSLLAAILFPVFSRAREQARRTTCLSNMKQIGMAHLQYLQDYDDRSVPRGGPVADPPHVAIESWRQRLYPYIKNVSMFRCPSRKVVPSTYSRADPAVGGYPEMPISYNLTNFFSMTDGTKITGYAEPSRKLMVVEAPETGVEWGHPNWTNSCTGVAINWTSNWLGNDNYFRGHLGTLNYLFVDGHAKAMRPTQTAEPYNMWGGTNCAPGITNTMARFNYSTPDPVITRAMQALEQIFAG